MTRLPIPKFLVCSSGKPYKAYVTLEDAPKMEIWFGFTCTSAARAFIQELRLAEGGEWMPEPLDRDSLRAILTYPPYDPPPYLAIDVKGLTDCNFRVARVEDIVGAIERGQGDAEYQETVIGQ